MVVLTKADQVEASILSALRQKLTKFVPAERIFTARLVVSGWALWDGETLRPF